MTVAEDIVHVWDVPLRASADALRELHAVLSVDERSRADAAGPASDRWRRYVVAHGAVRLIIGAYADVAPRRLRFVTGPAGKPRLAGAPPLSFNLSHVGDRALLALSGGRDVGADLAHCRPGFPVTAFAARYFPRPERDLVEAAGPDARRMWLRLWARKEACVKAAGTRLALGLTWPVAGAGDRCLVEDPTARVKGSWLVRDLPAPPGHAIGVALSGGGEFGVLRRSWRAEEALAGPRR